jgi:hypothetical protein
MSMLVFWFVTLLGLVGSDQRFGVIYCFPMFRTITCVRKQRSLRFFRSVVEIPYGTFVTAHSQSKWHKPFGYGRG